jgi:transcriptional regulator of arginine metabolism
VTAGAPAADPLTELYRGVRTWLESATPASNQLVLRTPPGGASPLAVALDEARLTGVLGTVAGDDTVLVICASPRAASKLARELCALEGATTAGRRA